MHIACIFIFNLTSAEAVSYALNDSPLPLFETKHNTAYVEKTKLPIQLDKIVLHLGYLAYVV